MERERGREREFRKNSEKICLFHYIFFCVCLVQTNEAFLSCDSFAYLVVSFISFVFWFCSLLWPSTTKQDKKRKYSFAFANKRRCAHFFDYNNMCASCLWCSLFWGLFAKQISVIVWTERRHIIFHFVLWLGVDVVFLVGSSFPCCF